MKTSKFNSIIRKDNHSIIHNSLYNTMIKVYDEQLQSEVEVLSGQNVSILDEFDEGFKETLVELKFIVDDNINEIDTLNHRFVQKLSMDSRKLSLYLIPTMQCNFRCPYCYEEHVNDRMDKNIYDSLLKMIVNYTEIYSLHTVYLNWFGGEPTLELSNIKEFTKNLKGTLSPDIKIISHMTTNGYLLSVDQFIELVNLGVVEYQITVDGFAETHNKTRFLANNNGTWDTIIKNLKDFKSTNLDFRVIIRSNLTDEIIKDRHSWFLYLSENFSDDPRFLFHFETVKDLGGEDKSFAYDLSNPEPSTYMIDEATSIGLNTLMKNNLGNFSMICYAADPFAFLIDHDGTVKKCTVALDDPKNNIGSVSELGELLIDENKSSWWTTYNKNLQCFDCKIYPICYSKKCPSAYYYEGHCQQLLDLYKGILTSY